MIKPLTICFMLLCLGLSPPSGRILSRFSGDLSMVDHHFSFILDDICHFCCIILVFLIVIGMIVPHIIPVLVFAMVFYSFQVVAVDRTIGSEKGNKYCPKPDYDIGSRDCEQPVLNPCNGL